MTEIITTLHPDNDENTNLYPNVKKENIPDGSIDRNKLDENVNTILDGLSDDIATAVASIQSPKYYSTLPTTNVGLIVYSDGYLYSWNTETSTYTSTGILYQNSLPIEFTREIREYCYQNLLSPYNMEYGHWSSNGGATGTTQFIRTKEGVNFKKGVKYHITFSGDAPFTGIIIRPYENGELVGSVTNLSRGNSIDYVGDYDWRIYTYLGSVVLSPDDFSKYVNVVNISFDFDYFNTILLNKINTLNQDTFTNLISKYDFEYGHWASNGGATNTTQFIRSKSYINFEKGCLYRITLKNTSPFGTLTLRPYENGQLVGSVVQLGKNQIITFVSNYDWRLYAYVGSTTIDYNDITSYLIIEKISDSKVFYIGANKQYTTLREGISEAIKYPNSIVYVDDGTYNLLDEFATEIANEQQSAYGIKLGNGVHVIFSSGALVTANYTGTSEYVKNYFAPFYLGDVNYNFLNDNRVNSVKGFTLENLNIIAGNTRYAVHDEGGEINDKVITKYINCRMYRSSYSTNYRQCIGGGMAKNHYVYINNCYFKNENAVDTIMALVSYHNNGNTNISNAESNIFISNCYFADKGTIRFGWHGDSTKISHAYCNNNSLGADIIVRHEILSDTDKPENIELISYLNEIRM